MAKATKTKTNKAPVNKPKPTASPVIKLLVKDNPKKAGSAAHRLFSLYKNGMTVEEYCSAVEKIRKEISCSHTGRGCIKWDVAHGFIEVKGGK